MPSSRFLITILSIAYYLLGCNTPVKDTTNSAPETSSTVSNHAAAEYPPTLQRALDAHGSLDRWKSYERLEYDLYREENLVDHQLIALDTRKVLLKNDQYQIGYDGKQVWVSPDTSAYPGSSARFYHNLQFYFFGLPFVLADPGINYEIIEPLELEGKTYDGLRITYQSDVGDASDDEYLAYFDRDTHQLHLLLYTVTYFSQSPSGRYSARVYEEWQTANGLTVPSKVTSYRWENDSLGEQRSITHYKNVVFDEIPPDQSIFLMPNQATVSDR